jgi:hypothetical protein
MRLFSGGVDILKNLKYIDFCDLTIEELLRVQFLILYTNNNVKYRLRHGSPSPNGVRCSEGS